MNHTDNLCNIYYSQLVTVLQTGSMLEKSPVKPLHFSTHSSFYAFYIKVPFLQEDLPLASALRRTKIYLRTAVWHARLNSLLVLHIQKELCNKLALSICLSQFISCSEHRLSLLGKISKLRPPMGPKNMPVFLGGRISEIY